MMKIGQPILMNEFMVSPVQFTSLNSVTFKNVKTLYDGNEKIFLEYEYQAKLDTSLRDWIGIFPRGWTTLQQYVTFEWVSECTPCGVSEQNTVNDVDVVRRTIVFNPQYHANVVNQNSLYQFVYVSKQIEVLGVSIYFRFDVASGVDSNVELECLVPVSSRIRSPSASDFGTLLNESSTTSLDIRTLHTSSIHSLQNLNEDGKVNWVKSLNVTDTKKISFMSRKSSATNEASDTLNPYISHSEPVFPMSLQMNQCKNCFHLKRGGELMKSQQVLQSKLKIVMERNKVLEERSQETKKDLERLQVESKRLKMTFYNVHKEKVAYEKFVKDFIKSLEKDSIVRVMNGNTEILVKKVNYVGMEEHPRDKKTSKRERELKAVIGLQEITIRNLISSLHEKAKSVEELNQTVKLAQAFSEARKDDKESSSEDSDDSMDEASNSDVTSEYEFSLSKPQPPEEVATDAGAVLDDIRRTSEMELKDIGINRSLGPNSSQGSDSEFDVTNLSVHSFQNKDEAENMPEKTSFFRKIEDCWPFQGSSEAKRALRKPCEKGKEEVTLDENANKSDSLVDETGDKNWTKERDNMKNKSDANGDIPKQTINEKCDSARSLELDLEIDASTCEDYYDAFDAFSVKSPLDPEHRRLTSRGEAQENEGNNTIHLSENAKEKEGFSLTAIVPQNLNLRSARSSEDFFRPKEEFSEGSPHKEKDCKGEKRKKFTCEFSIDFMPKRPQSAEGSERSHAFMREGRQKEVVSLNQLSPVVVNKDSQIYSLKREQSLITFKQSKQCLEIQITQVDSDENAKKNCLHQKMVLTFAGNNQTNTGEETCTSSLENPVVKKNQFEFNLELTGLGEHKNFNTKQLKSQTESSDDDSLETKLSASTEEEKESNVEAEVISPRTVWNDASDSPESDIAEKKEETAESVVCQNSVAEAPEPEAEEASAETEKKVSVSGDEIVNAEIQMDMLTDDSINNFKLYQDSLRYEKNLQFLQSKTDKNDTGKEDSAKEKPSAILIQNGQTKVALIRYQ